VGDWVAERVFMSTALQSTAGMSAAIEACLINGDLKLLDTAGRLEYYKAVCQSLGLNPLTRPFEYITLNGKLTLYAKRDCAEQLRKKHGVRIQSMIPQQIGDLFVVTVTAADMQGRTDSSTGAVCIKGLAGEALANAMMKAETKAKRRVTLSLCGLGLLDETEVASIPDAREWHEPEPMKVGPMPTPKVNQLEADLTASVALEGQKAFSVVGNRVKAYVVDVVRKTSKKGTAYSLVTIEGSIEGSDALFCYHGSLQEALGAAKGHICQFEWSLNDKWLTIEDVLDIGGVDYRDGKPFMGELGITNNDIPESLFEEKQ
jgi:hypothetical protein